jgi:hypothetical protein
MRKLLLALVLMLAFAFAAAGPALGSEPRCCVNPHPGGPPQTGGGLPFTGLPLYIPVLLSLGAIGTGVVLRRRTREEL